MNDPWLAQSEGAPALLSPVFPDNQGRIRALLMEGEREVSEHLQSMLIHEACDVSAFCNVTSACADLDRGLRPNVAFINWQMQGRHGSPALAWFRQDSPTVPAIALSCSYDPRSIVEAMNMGAVDVLVQPFDRRELKSSLQRWVNSPIAGGDR